MRNRRWIPTLALLLMISASALYAQLLSTGNVVGRVIDASGDPIPGVTVTLTGIGAPQTFVTSNDGEYRFRNLAPGRYQVGAELAGFGSLNRSAVVAVGSNTEVEMRLTPALDETITVTSESPMLDVRKTGTGQNVTEIELENVPTARDPWVILQSIPGVLVDRVNVGGNESGQQSYFVSKGAERHQTEWNLDGVTVTEMQATGTSGFYYDFESFQEFNVTTGGSDPSVKTPGAQINMVTRRGTNDFNGSARYLFTDKDLQETATVPAEAQDYLEQGNSIDRIEEAGVELGGPLMRDRLWLWGAVSRNEIANTVNDGVVPTQLESINAKLNAQIVQNNSANLFYMWNNKEVEGRGATLDLPLSSTRNQTGPGDVWKIEDTHIFSPNFYLTGMIGIIDNGYELRGRGGDVEPYWEGRRNAEDGFSRGWRRNRALYIQDVPQDQYRADGSSFFETGDLSHELKFGFGYRDAPVESWTIWPGSMSWAEFYAGDDIAGLSRPGHPVYGAEYTDFYVGDTVLLGNLTIQGGLRYDLQSAQNFESRVPANPIIPDILPEGVYPGDERALEWESISPRLGATWAIGEDRKTLLRGHYARYVDQLGSSDVGPQNPYYVDQLLYYYWEDTNADTFVQREEILFEYGLYNWNGIDPNNPDSTISTGRLDYDMDPTSTDEFVLGIEHELRPAFSVGLAYTHRIRDNFLWEQYEKTQGAGDFYVSSDWEAYDSLEGTLPNGEQYTVPTFALREGLEAPVYYLYTNRPDYKQIYNGIELTATRRMADNWMLRGNVSWNDWTQEIGPAGIQNPNRLLEGDGCYTCDGGTVASSGGSDGYINARWAGALSGIYQFPFDITFGAAATFREGYILGYYREYDLNDERKDILVADFDEFRLPDMLQVDLRIGKTFNLPAGIGLQIAADLFNATNERTILWRGYELFEDIDGAFDDDGNRIEEIQSPRLWRLSGRITF